MTTSTSPDISRSARNRNLGIGVAASVLHMLMLTQGYFEDDEFLVDEYLMIWAVSLAVAVLVFLSVVPKGGGVTALVLGVLAILTNAVFWAGVALPLAAAAVVVGLRERTGGARAGLATAGAALGALAAVLLVAAIISDAMAD